MQLFSVKSDLPFDIVCTDRSSIKKLNVTDRKKINPLCQSTIAILNIIILYRRIYIYMEYNIYNLSFIIIYRLVLVINSMLHDIYKGWIPSYREQKHKYRYNEAVRKNENWRLTIYRSLLPPPPRTTDTIKLHIVQSRVTNNCGCETQKFNYRACANRSGTRTGSQSDDELLYFYTRVNLSSE